MFDLVYKESKLISRRWALGSKQQLPSVEHYRINYRIVYYMGQRGNGCAHKDSSWLVESSHV